MVTSDLKSKRSRTSHLLHISLDELYTGEAKIYASATYRFLLTYFEFQDTDEQVFRALLEELRDQRANPEWAYITLELEIWMTKIG